MGNLADMVTKYVSRYSNLHWIYLHRTHAQLDDDWPQDLIEVEAAVNDINETYHFRMKVEPL